MKSLTIVLAALLAGPACLPACAQEDIVVFTLSSDDISGVENSSDELKELAHAADAECRQYPNEARTFANCAARNVYLEILEARGVCNVGPFLWDENWVACAQAAEPKPGASGDAAD